ncbi:hypothetical protein L208DRAFT_1418356 [Tricholoma matsutake]|nr:hypothetical protein L208DRAFT_1418356 [Tricholoma matsutake 945]
MCHALSTHSLSPVWMCEASFPAAGFPTKTVASGNFHIILCQHPSIQSLVTIIDTHVFFTSSCSVESPLLTQTQQLPIAFDFVSCLQGQTILLKFPSTIPTKHITISTHIASHCEGKDHLKIVAFEQYAGSKYPPNSVVNMQRVDSWPGSEGPGELFINIPGIDEQ